MSLTFFLGVQIGNACWELYTIEHGLSVSTMAAEKRPQLRDQRARDLNLRRFQRRGVSPVHAMLTPFLARWPPHGGLSLAQRRRFLDLLLRDRLRQARSPFALRKL